MNIPFLDLAYQERVIREDREARFAKIIGDTAFVLGPAVAEFESEFATYIGTSEAVGVSGGTHALTMIFRALGIGEGDEVITIPTTFIASVTPILEVGAIPVLVDIDPSTRDFNFEALEATITPRTKAILPVHLYGQPSDMDRVRAIAEKHSLLIVEDACQAHGARYKGTRVGTFGKAAAFSFFPGKNLGAYGDGGAVVTNDSEIANIVRALRNQGCVTKYDHVYRGYNGRLDALQAAVLSAKLPHLDAWNAMRSTVASQYYEAFKDLPVSLPPVIENTEPVWHLFAIEILEGERDTFMEHLAKDGIASGIHYPVPLHKTPALKELGYASQSYPYAEALAARVVSLPAYPGMSEEAVDYVIRSVRTYFHANKQ